MKINELNTNVLIPLDLIAATHNEMVNILKSAPCAFRRSWTDFERTGSAVPKRLFASIFRIAIWPEATGQMQKIYFCWLFNRLREGRWCCSIDMREVASGNADAIYGGPQGWRS